MVRRTGSRRSEQGMLRKPAKPTTETDRQRIDRWLWHARVVPTRGTAAALAGSGHVRVNGARIHAPSRMVRTGDVITVALERQVRVLKVNGFAERRGPARTAQRLYREVI